MDKKEKSLRFFKAKSFSFTRRRRVSEALEERKKEKLNKRRLKIKSKIHGEFSKYEPITKELQFL